jgi:hypothetical protein
MLKSILWRAIERSAGPKSLGDTNYRKRRDNEDTDNDSDIGVTAHGVRPDGGATTDAGAN